MSLLFERVSYLRGLADGLDIDKAKKEGKLLAEIVSVLEEMAYAIEDLEGNLKKWTNLLMQSTTIYLI